MPHRAADVLRSIEPSVVERLQILLERLGSRARSIGLDRPATSDVTELLVEKAVSAPLGDPSEGWDDRTATAGGRGRMLSARDGWVAVNLVRPSDWELVPAWLGEPGPFASWERIAASLAVRSTVDLVDRAVLVGLAVAAPSVLVGPAPVRTTPGAGRRDMDRRRAVRVVDLSALWAGPLAGRLLAESGAEVIKVESVTRPDGFRSGAPALYHQLNGSKDRVDLDLGTAAGRHQLAALCRSADVVIEASRPRAMAQLGIDVDRIVHGGTVWVSITGYGREAHDGQRVAFGDDAAVAGGAWVDRGDAPPWFVGDAFGDPVSGITAAVAALDALAGATASLIEIVMRDAVAAVVADRVPVVS